MNPTEERLSDALEALASTVSPETVRPLSDAVLGPDQRAADGDLPGPAGHASPRPRRPRAWLVPVAAAAAVVLLVVLSLLLTRTGHAPPPAHPPAPQPRYYTVYRAMPGGNGPHPGDDVIEVRDSATGRVHDTLDLTRTLGGKSGFHYWSDNALTSAGERAFFVGYARSPSDWRVYRLQLTSSGRVTGFTPVFTAPGGNGSPTAMAVSPDGTLLAIAPNPSSTGSTEIVVANLATGTQAIWRGGIGPSGTVSVIAQLSWGADGRTLAFLFQRGLGKGDTPAFPDIISEVRTLDASQPGGSLANGRLVLSQPPSRTEFIEQAAISPDGKSIISADLIGPVSSQTQLPGDVQVNQAFIAPYGCCDRVLYQGPAGSSTSPYLRDDGAGNWLLTANWKLGWISGGRMHDLPPGQDGTVTDVAW